MAECDLFLSDHTPGSACDDAGHRAALARRAEGAPPWSPIERGADASGDRDFLAGEPIHCGATLELQAVEDRSDDFGDFTIKMASGIRVRYELAWPKGRSDRREIVVHGSLGGHAFTSPHQPWMRFRWPSRD